MKEDKKDGKENDKGKKRRKEGLGEEILGIEAY